MTKHFNKLTPAEAERLAMLAEECAEVVKAVTKILRHGYASWNPDDPAANASPSSKTNRHTIRLEMIDVLAVMEVMFKAGDIDVPGQADVLAALDKKLRYAHHQ